MTKKHIQPIHIAEYVAINGIEQFLYHSGTSAENPVLLYLHGGPGCSEALFAHLFQEKWEELYTVIHWDQRGAGKTLTRNPKAYGETELLLQDLLEIIHYLKLRYSKEKIVLMGHSWGTVLGTLFLQRHPEEVAYYIGASQVVSMVAGEKAAYEKLKTAVMQSGDKKALAGLQALGDYPGDKIEINKHFIRQCKRFRKLQAGQKLAVEMKLSTWIAALRSPIFQLSDILAFQNAMGANRSTYQFFAELDLLELPADYQVPVYYLLGDNDWQVPSVLAEEYHQKINAPEKKCYRIMDAGHMLMIDQPERCYEALADIHRREEQGSLY